MTTRRTYAVQGSAAARRLKLDLAPSVGVQISSLQAIAARLAGGFLQPIGIDELRIAVAGALADTDLGEIEPIKSLPGMLDASADTLRKLWAADLDLETHTHPRVQAILELEAAVVTRLPKHMLRPCDLVEKAVARIEHAPAVIGRLDIVGQHDLAPCWRELVVALSKVIPVRWHAGNGSEPAWIDPSDVEVVRFLPLDPTVTTVACATAQHEALEAVRWARELVASGKAKPHEIAIASPATAEYDDAFLSLRNGGDLPIHFSHGIPVTTTPEGQAAAALADILVRGLTHTRFRRLVHATVGMTTVLQDIPGRWLDLLPPDAPLSTLAAWRRTLARIDETAWPDEIDRTSAILAIVSTLAAGTMAAELAGDLFLTGPALELWEKALVAGHASAVDRTLEGMRRRDDADPYGSVQWLSASELMACPHRHVRLLGLTSSGWPRKIVEDRLLPNHVVATHDLEPLTVAENDRADFRTILETTTESIVLSRPRREAGGRVLGRSPLLRTFPLAEELHLSRHRIPEHAANPSDRLLARPADFTPLPHAVSAIECWTDWQSPELTAHDGLVRADHPVMASILNRTQSASSLRLLLRNPLGFVWKYGLGMQEPRTGTEPLQLEALEFGDLFHAALDHIIREIEQTSNIAVASEDLLGQAMDDGIETVRETWEARQAIPPRALWLRTLAEIRTLAVSALALEAAHLEGQESHSEVPFGGARLKNDVQAPWDVRAPVAIPGTSLTVAGYIDRLDLSEARDRARVRDYKTGKGIDVEAELNGGKELQRAIYTVAVRALLGAAVQIEASLIFPKDGTVMPLADHERVLADLVVALNLASANLLAGNGIAGVDAGDTYDDLQLALPANAGSGYRLRKESALAARLGAAVDIWEAK